MNVSSVRRALPNVKESHEILILTHEVSNYLHRRSQFLDNDWLSSQNLCTFIGQLNDMFPLAWKFLSRLDILTIFWLHEWLHEHLTKCIIWVLIDLCMILLLRIQFLWLLSKLIDRDLSYDERKIFSSGFIDLILLI
jgi:hypothetical protein